MKPRDAAATVYRLSHQPHPASPQRVDSFIAGWDAAVRRLKSEQHKIQTGEGGIGWIARDSIDGAIALLENGTKP